MEWLSGGHRSSDTAGLLSKSGMMGARMPRAPPI